MTCFTPTPVSFHIPINQEILTQIDAIKAKVIHEFDGRAQYSSHCIDLRVCFLVGKYFQQMEDSYQNLHAEKVRALFKRHCVRKVETHEHVSLLDMIKNALEVFYKIFIRC